MRQREALLNEIYKQMKKDEKIFFVSADFGSPVVDKIKSDFEDRFINVGIAEQNLINISTGLSLEGFTVFAYAIAPFITLRALEQIRVNLAILSQIRKLNVNLIGVGAGTSYDVSGPTHHTFEDIGVINTLPEVEIFVPSDNFLAKSYVQRAIELKKIKYIRIDAKIDYEISDEVNFDKGFRVVKKSDNNVFILSMGYFLNYALQFDANVVDIFLINNFDKNKLLELLENAKKIIIIEDAFDNTGLSSIIKNLFDDNKLCSFSFEKKYIFEVGNREKIHESYGIKKEKIKRIIDEHS